MLAYDRAIHLLRKRLDHRVTRLSLSSGRALRGPVGRGPVMASVRVAELKKHRARAPTLIALLATGRLAGRWRLRRRSILLRLLPGILLRSLLVRGLATIIAGNALPALLIAQIPLLLVAPAQAALFGC